jgi:hypothetical protein
MIILMGTILLGILIVGTAALSSHPLYLIAAAAVLACVILVVARQASGERLVLKRRR